jgi:hypothetical protein
MNALKETLSRLRMEVDELRLKKQEYKTLQEALNQGIDDRILCITELKKIAGVDDGVAIP